MIKTLKKYLDFMKYKTKKKNTKLSNNLNNLHFNILINIIEAEILILLKSKLPKPKIKAKIILLLKEIRNNNKIIKKTTPDSDLTIIFNDIYINTLKLNKKTNKKTNKKEINTKSKSKSKNTIYEGGFYFKTLEEKGDQPLTGNDLVGLLDEMQAFFYNAQYTNEGAFVKDPNTLISLLRGNTDAFKNYVMYSILPKYYQTFPPFIKWGNVRKFFEDKVYEDLPDYLMAYQSYMRSRDEYLVGKGLKSPDVLNRDLYTGLYNKLAISLDKNITKMQQFRNKVKGASPLTFPL